MKKPRYLYKYRPIDTHKDKPTGAYLREAIVDRRIFFGTVHDFNDPYDCSPAFSFESTEREKLFYLVNSIRKRDPNLSAAENLRLAHAQLNGEQGVLVPGSEAFMAHWHVYFRNIMLRRLPMFCASEVCDDILLWSHYAQNHKGVCLQFDTEAEDFSSVQRVKYTRRRPVVNPIRRRSDDQMMTRTLLHKASKWAYEREWRVFNIGGVAGPKEISPAAITGVILGCNVEPETRALIKRFIAESGRNITLSQAAMSPRQYKIHIEPA